VILSVITLAAAMLIRRIGVALVPALSYALWPSKAQRSSIKSFLAARKIRVIAIAAVCVIALAAATLAFRKALYLPDWKFGGSPLAAARLQLKIRMIDFGELFCNVPAAKLGRLQVFIPLAGMVLAILIAIGLWRVRRNPRPTHVYLLAYLAIMAVWPYGDARFWLPLFPVLAIIVLQAIHPPKFPAIKFPAAAYLAVYALLAIVALAYSTRLTFAGRRFPELYGSGSLTRSYEAAWGKSAADPTDTVVPLIRRYGMVSAPNLGAVNVSNSTDANPAP
jgi:hypothetical protein